MTAGQGKLEFNLRVARLRVTALSGHLWADDTYRKRNLLSIYGRRGGQASSEDLLPLGYGERERSGESDKASGKVYNRP